MHYVMTTGAPQPIRLFVDILLCIQHSPSSNQTSVWTFTYERLYTYLYYSTVKYLALHLYCRAKYSHEGTVLKMGEGTVLKMGLGTDSSPDGTVLMFALAAFVLWLPKGIQF
jgi:hypothetical protein